MKRIYFVRHGESEGNTTPTFSQTPENPLTPRGEMQAAFIARRAASLPVEVIVASTDRRALQTGQRIQQELGCELIESSLFVERRRPKHLIGRSWEDPEIIEYEAQREERFHDASFRYADDETFSLLHERAKACFSFLESLPQEQILVATHGYFLRVLVAYAVFGESLTSHIGKLILERFTTENTGITILEQHDSQPGVWRLVTWNDYAHLADAEI